MLRDELLKSGAGGLISRAVFVEQGSIIVLV